MRYITGTASVVNNGYVVTGVGTSWASLSLPLFFSLSGEKVYEVSRIVDNTTLWITDLYTGATAGGHAYTLADSFTPLYHFPIVTVNDSRKADTLSSLLIAVERELYELGADSTAITGTRYQQYRDGVALFAEDSTTVQGYNTFWTTLSYLTDVVTTLTGGSGIAYFPVNYWHSTYFPSGYWPFTTQGTTAEETTGYYGYIKRQGDYKVYTISAVVNDTTLTLSEDYSDEASYTPETYNDSSTYYPGNMVSFDSDLWIQDYDTYITGIPPISNYDSSTNYAYGNIVLSGGSRYTYINTTIDSGNSTDSTAYWRATTDTDLIRTAFRRYWTLFTGYDYQIVTSITENNKLPVMTTGALEYYTWFSKALLLIDEILV